MKNKKIYGRFIKYTLGHKAGLAGFISLALFLCVVIVVLTAVWMPVDMKYKSIENKIQELKNLKIKNKEDKEFMEFYAGTVKTASAIEKKLFKNAGAGDVFADINGLAKKYTLTLSVQNTSGQKESRSGYDVMERDITVYGKYENIRRFIQGLENLDSLTVLNRVRIKREGETPSLVKAGIKLTVYKKITG